MNVSKWCLTRVWIIGVVVAFAVNDPHQVAHAQEFEYFDDFDDVDVTSRSDGFALSQCASWMVTRSSISAESGDLVVESDADGSSTIGWIAWCPYRFNGERIPQRDEWSFRVLATVDEGEIYVGALYNH